jgi:hypothetical protein
MCLRRAVFFASLAWLPCACSAAAHDAIHTYDQARYPEALERLRSTESLATRWEPRDRARYALYRGLTHLALGDRRDTARWLEEARRAWNRDPTVFSDDERSRLAAALAHLRR